MEGQKHEPENNKEIERQVVGKELEKSEEAAAAEELNVIENLPPHVSKKIEIFEMLAAGRISPSRGISDKLTENHITKILELQEKQIDYEHVTEKQGRNHFLGIYMATALFFLAMVTFLVIYNKDQLLIDIIKIVGAFAGGFGAGIGAKSHFDKKK